MAGYSIVSKMIIRQTIDRSLVTENKETNNVSIEHIDKLFEQLTELLTNTNKTSSIKSILSDLNQICCRLVDQTDYSASYAFDIFKSILKHYIKLFDIDQFVKIITQHYSTANNDFLRSFINIIHQYDIPRLAKQMTPKARREIFLFLFELLSTSTRMVYFLQNKLLITSTNDNTNRTIINFCGSILYAVLEVSDWLKVKVTDNDIEKYQNTLFTPFITFLDEYFMTKKCLRVNEQHNNLLISRLLSFVWNLTDKTPTIPIFINANCPQACLQWLSLSHLSGYEYNCIINILNNIARHDEGAMILNKSDCAKIIREKCNVTETKIDFIIDPTMRKKLCLITTLTFALVIDSNEFLVDTIKSGIIDHLLSIIKETSELLQFYWEKVHISEPLIALMKLCVNDKIIHYILKQEQFPRLFFATLKSFLSRIDNKKNDDTDRDLDVLSVIALANIIWSISFHDQYRNDLIRNIELIKTLETFSATGIIDKILTYSFIPHRMLSLPKVIDGIWQNLYPSLPPESEIHTSTNSLTKDNPIRSLMISYSHVNIDFCRQLYDVLNEDPVLSISVDINNSKHLWKEIAQTIEQSDIVLFLISTDFFHSKSCRQELIYVTDTLKKPFIPVFIDADYKTTGWLDTQIAPSKYIRFGTTDFMNTCDELLLIIHESLSMSIFSVRKSSDINQWNDKEVRRWFTDNNVPPELCDFYQFQNGHELLVHAQARLEFPWINEYDRIRLRFEEKFKQKDRSLSPHDFLKFTHALERLKSKALSSI